MQAFVDNKPFEVARLGCRELGSGQPIPESERFRVEFVLTTEEMRELMARRFDTFVEECRRDDEMYGGTEVEDIAWSNYASYDELFDLDQTVLGNVIRQFLVSELLEAITGKNLPEAMEIMVNRIEGVVFSGSEVRVAGEGVSAR